MGVFGRNVLSEEGRNVDIYIKGAHAASLRLFIHGTHTWSTHTHEMCYLNEHRADITISGSNIMCSFIRLLYPRPWTEYSTTKGVCFQTSQTSVYHSPTQPMTPSNYVVYILPMMCVVH